ncbi:MAG TPA: C-terminal helicase domain-containing protein [Verrucomicrobiae bacterium]|nr:C-terminal helicase domain-containing protein [Verrucomicrobiae bacterium]
MLVRDHCDERDIGYAWHTGTVPQKRRRAEINAFKDGPKCRVFLSTDAGATGLNLQNASVVINCDLPWNPAKLEQRIGRAWRKHQTKSVTVINLISENTLEHRMLETLAMKQAVAVSVLDKPGEVKEIKLRSGRQAMIERLQQLITPTAPRAGQPPAAPASRPADPALAFSQMAAERINGALLRCEERYPQSGSHSVLVVVVDGNPNDWREKLKTLHAEMFGRNKTDPLAPVQLEVLDRATDEAIQRLMGMGLISKTTRATRLLFPSQEAEAAPLSAEELAKAKAHRERAVRKLKMARVLGNTGFVEEARAALLDAIHESGIAMAVERRLPAPAELKDALQPPLSHGWGEPLPILRDFACDPALAWKPVAERLAGLLAI